MKYRRSPIEIESPEQFGYENIECNLAESSVPDAHLKHLEIHLEDLVLQYGDHLGKPELRELLAGESDDLEANDVLLTIGAAGALFIVATSLLDRGDHVVAVFPNYVTNIETPRTIECDVDYLHLRFEEGFCLDLDELSSLIRPNTKLVSLTSPHNPTGQVMTEGELSEVVRMVESSGAYLLLDETYRGMSFSDTPPLAAALTPRAISVSSLSKTYGLPGIRSGWLICQDERLMETFLAAKEQIHICHSVLDEEIAFKYLENKDTHLENIRRDIARKFEVMKDWMNGQDDLEWREPEGGVVCFPRIKEEIDVNTDAFYRILNDDYKTFVGPGHWFEHDRLFMRIGYGWPADQELAQGLRNITRALRDATK
jgi:aspartate/methionine/tyrosine aminotransferase